MIHKHDIENYYEAQAVEYDREFYLSDSAYPTLKFRHQHILDMIQALDLPADARILDVGCGPGELVVDLVAEEREIHGVDIAAEMIALAEARVARLGEIPNTVVLATGDIEALAYPDDHFDLIVASGVVEYLRDDEAWSSEVCRTLKPGGYLILNVTNKLAVRKWTEPVVEAVKAFEPARRVLGFVKERILRKGPLHYFPFRPRKHTPRAFDRFLETLGFRKLSHAYFDFSLFPAPLDVFLPGAPQAPRTLRAAEHGAQRGGVHRVRPARPDAAPLRPRPWEGFTPALSCRASFVHSTPASMSASVLRFATVVLLAVLGFGAPALAQTEAPACEVEEASIADLQAMMTDGRCSARQITQAYLDRIDALDRSGPALRSVLTTNPDALEIADALDLERAEGAVRGPLHGIPVLVKDNVGTADRMPTTAGALALEGVIAPEDAHIIARLREAGAGHPRQDEPQRVGPTSARRTRRRGGARLGGQTRNPYVLDRSPCGSSAGTGAAVAASLGAVGVGTETDGSVICPSSANGLVGIKPTVGLVSRAGIIPLSHSQDTAGPMARSVADAALLLSVMAGSDPADTTTDGSVGLPPARLRRLPRPRCPGRGSPRRAARLALGRQPGHGPDRGCRRRSDAGRRGRDRRLARPAGRLRRRRVHGPPLRLQARPRRLPRRAPDRAGEVARGRDRL